MDCGIRSANQKGWSNINCGAPRAGGWSENSRIEIIADIVRQSRTCGLHVSKSGKSARPTAQQAKQPINKSGGTVRIEVIR